jgi:hypothetical protein
MFNKKGIASVLLCTLMVFPASVSSVYALSEDEELTWDSLATVTFIDGSSNPIVNQSIDLRVSLWDVFDVRSGDVDGSGSINTSALHYGAYTATATITPDSNGLYRGSPGSGEFVFGARDFTSFPTSIGSNNAFLQFEYKLSGAPSTDYVTYDFVDDPPYNNITRLNLMKSLSYTTSDAGSRTNNNSFTLDANNNASSSVVLQFGETLAKTLLYSISNTRFELSDSLVIAGGLTASGTINFAAANVGIGTSSPLSALHVADGYYAQFEDNNVGSPAASDCDANAERGRLSIDTQNNRLYICNGATRGWDYLPLTD